VLDLMPQNIKIVKLANENFGIEFDFPDAYAGLFEFTAARSPDLVTPFVATAGALPPASLGPGTDRWVIDLGVLYSSQDRQFFHLWFALK
jgi:hypothetical protein